MFSHIFSVFFFFNEVHLIKEQTLTQSRVLFHDDDIKIIGSRM